MTRDRLFPIRSVILALLCLLQSLSVSGFDVNGLKDAGFFDVEKSIPNIACSDDLGVTRLTSQENCQIPIDIGPDNAIGNIDSDAEQSPGVYEIEPLNFISYAIFCKVGIVTRCFTAMTYNLKLDNSTDGEFKCEMNFTAGASEASSDRLPTKITWKKNGKTLKDESRPLTDADFTKITDTTTDSSGVFYVSSTLTVDTSNSTSSGEYTCFYGYKTQELTPENTAEVAAAPDVTIMFKLQTEVVEENKPKEESDNDDDEKQYTDGDTVKITCRAAGYPRPTLRWMHEGKELTSVNIMVEETADYVFSSFIIKELDDAVNRGNYSCIAENGIKGANTEKFRILHARDRLAPLWPFIGIVAQVIVLAVVIAIGEKFRKKKVAEKKRRMQQTEHQAGPSDKSNSEI